MKERGGLCKLKNAYANTNGLFSLPMMFNVRMDSLAHSRILGISPTANDTHFAKYVHFVPCKDSGNVSPLSIRVKRSCNAFIRIGPGVRISGT